MDESITIQTGINEDFVFPNINPDGRVLVIGLPLTANDSGDSNQKVDNEQLSQGDGTRVSDSKMVLRVTAALQKVGIQMDLLSIRPGENKTKSLATYVIERYHVINGPRDDVSVISQRQHSDKQSGFLKDVTVDEGGMTHKGVLKTIQDILASINYSLLIMLDQANRIFTDDLLREIETYNDTNRFSVLTYAYRNSNDIGNGGTESKTGYVAFPLGNGGIVHFNNIAMFGTGKSKGIRPTMKSALHKHKENRFMFLAYGLAIGIPFPRLSTAIDNVILKQPTFDPIQLVKECGRVLYTREAAMQLKRLLQKTKTSVVLTTGCFDIFHAGHADALDDTKKQAEVLVIALNSDESVRRLKGNKRPICLLKDRLRVLLALGSVDFVVVFSEKKPEWVVDILDPDVIAKGPDYSLEQLRKSFPDFKHDFYISRPWYVMHTSDIIEKCKL